MTKENSKSFQIYRRIYILPIKYGTANIKTRTLVEQHTIKELYQLNQPLLVITFNLSSKVPFLSSKDTFRKDVSNFFFVTSQDVSNKRKIELSFQYYILYANRKGTRMNCVQGLVLVMWWPVVVHMKTSYIIHKRHGCCLLNKFFTLIILFSYTTASFGDSTWT